MLISEKLPRRPSSPSQARKALLPLAPHVDEGVLSDLRLLVSELVTNAIEHVEAPGDVELTIRLEGATVRVDVLDPGTGFRPAERNEDSPLNSQWGLHFVRTLSERWGVHDDGRGHVWFEMATRDAARSA